MGESNKKNETRKCLNCTNLIATDPSIFCHACEKWTHGHSAKVSKEQMELLEQIEGAMWFCDKCRCYVKRSIQTRLTEFKAEVDKKLTDVRDLVKQTIAKHNETTEKLFEEVHEAAKRTAKQIEQGQTNTSGASYASALGQTNHTLQTGSQNYIIPQRNPEHILIASSTFNFRDSVQTKKQFTKHFPFKRLIHVFNTTRRNVHLDFESKEEADEILEYWKPEFLGDSTKIRRALSTEKPNRAVIIKKVPLDVTDEMIQSRLDIQFTNATATRYIKRDSTKLGTVKIVLKSENDLGKALHQGLLIDFIYYKSKHFVQNGKQIVRCFRCQKFGHISAKCHSAENCGHCIENHLLRYCPNENQESKCANYNLKNPANYIQCDVYFKQLQTVRKCSGLDQSTPHNG